MVEAPILRERSLAIPDSRQPLTMASVLGRTLPEFVYDPTLQSLRSQARDLRTEEQLLRQQTPEKARLANLQRSEAKKALGQVAQVVHKATQDYLALSGPARFVIDYLLPPFLQDRVVPLSRAVRTHQLREEERTRAERLLTQVYKEAEQRQRELEGEKSQARKDLDEATRVWVLADRERVLSYALSRMSSHPQSRQVLFREFSGSFGKDADSIFGNLVTDYNQLTVCENPVADDNYQTQDRGGNYASLSRSRNGDGQEAIQPPKESKSIRKSEDIGTSERSVPYALGVLIRPQGGAGYTYTLVEDGEIPSFVDQKAKGLIKRDQTRRENILGMVESLRQDPHGLGTKKMRGQEVVVDSKLRLPLRSFNPAKRPNIQLRDQSLMNSRIVYVVINNGGERILAILDICDHGDYTLRYASFKY